MKSKGRIGFEYLFECFSKEGDLLWAQRARNLIPDEGRDYILNAALLLGAQMGTWYCALYEGSYAPQAGDTMATFPAAGVANEIVAYSEAARPVLVPDALSGGLFVNAASPAVFTFTADKTVRGGFITSGSVKGGVTGVLLSAVLAPSPKTVAAGDQLRVTAGLSLVTI